MNTGKNHKIRTLKEMDVMNKRVIVRVDYNVPLSKDGKILDSGRIKASVPTIIYLLKKNCRIILMTHFGRPDGKVVESLRLNQIAKEISTILGKKLIICEDCIGKKAKDAVKHMCQKDILLLENLRFHPEEEKNDREFGEHLAALGEIYVNDAFGASHRSHASVSAITEFLPSCIGFLMEKEIENLSKVLNPKKPFFVVIGGAKIADKIEMLSLLSKKADALIIGGAMANTFLLAKGKKLGASKVEKESIGTAACIMKKASVMLPVDLVCSSEAKEGVKTIVIDIEKEYVADNMMALDIGPKSCAIFQKCLANAKTVLWNGPMGMYEISKFSSGTKKMAEAIAKLQATTIVAGGDTAAIIEKLGMAKLFTHVSTGGGASLEYLSGKTLPAIAAIAISKME